MSREERFNEILGLIRRNQVLTDMLDEAAAGYLGINRTDARALDVIDQRGQIAAGDLARELRLSTGAVTTLVDRLERAGFARRVPDPTDRRRVLLEVTPVVQENAERIYGPFDEAFEAYNDYTDHDIEVVLRFQRMSQAWLEEHLARVSELSSSKPPKQLDLKRSKKRLRGHGET
jgi:DNA-binding MarR family transcriptional regulator